LHTSAKAEVVPKAWFVQCTICVTPCFYVFSFFPTAKMSYYRLKWIRIHSCGNCTLCCILVCCVRECCLTVAGYVEITDCDSHHFQIPDSALRQFLLI